MHRPCAPEGDQHELARVVAALHRHEAQCIHHGRVGDLHDAVCGGHDVQPERVGAFLLDRRARRGHVQLDLTAEKVVRVEAAEHQVGVGHRGLAAAFAVADRTGVGAGAARTDAQRAAGIHPGNRAAAGANLN